MAPPSTHVEPIQKHIPFSKKVLYAKHRANQKIIKMRDNSAKRIQTTAALVVINLLQVLAIIAVILAIVFIFVKPDFSNGQQKDSNMAAGSSSPNSSPIPGQSDNSGSSNNSQTGQNEIPMYNNSDNDSSSGNAQSNPNSNSEPLTGSLAERLKSALLEAEGVSDFSNITDSNNLISKIKQLTSSSDGKVTVRLSVGYSDTTRAQIKDTAKQIISLVQNRVPDLLTVILCTNDNYYIEPASRTN